MRNFAKFAKFCGISHSGGNPGISLIFAKDDRCLPAFGEATLDFAPNSCFVAEICSARLKRRQNHYAKPKNIPRTAETNSERRENTPYGLSLEVTGTYIVYARATWSVRTDQTRSANVKREHRCGSIVVSVAGRLLGRRSARRAYPRGYPPVGSPVGSPLVSAQAPP